MASHVLQARKRAQLLEDRGIRAAFVQGEHARACRLTACLHMLPALGYHAAVSAGSAEALPFAARSFDCVVDTFSLCTFSRPQQALSEVARVLRKGGTALLAEHSRSDFPPLAWYQDVTDEAVAAASKGCHWNQNLLQLLANAGLRPVQLRPALGGFLRFIVAEPCSA